MENCRLFVETVYSKHPDIYQVLEELMRGWRQDPDRNSKQKVGQTSKQIIEAIRRSPNHHEAVKKFDLLIPPQVRIA